MKTGSEKGKKKKVITIVFNVFSLYTAVDTGKRVTEAISHPFPDTHNKKVALSVRGARNVGYTWNARGKRLPVSSESFRDSLR